MLQWMTRLSKLYLILSKVLFNWLTAFPEPDPVPEPSLIEEVFTTLGAIQERVEHISTTFFNIKRKRNSGTKSVKLAIIKKSTSHRFHNLIIRFLKQGLIILSPGIKISSMYMGVVMRYRYSKTFMSFPS